MNPKYPVYIISKGRWESRLTSKALELMNVPYHIVVEPKEYDKYSSVIDPKKIYILPDNFSELKQGGIPVRNWVWEHSIENGHKRHWILDDNIMSFFRVNNNRKTLVGDGTIFRCIEDFCDRYENVKISGMEYEYFMPEKMVSKPYILNTRIYSCILISNDLTHRWRGRYNEDTDLSLRVLKDGWCTILFYAFLANKQRTGTLPTGGNRDIYDSTDNRREFAESLKRQHPDVVEVVWKFNRWHHQVNYAPFKKNKLIKKEGLVIPEGINNYGMKLVEVRKGV